jgi:hypothetical protein
MKGSIDVLPLSFLKFHYEYVAGVSLSNDLIVVSGILSQGNKPVTSDRTLTGVSRVVKFGTRKSSSRFEV